MGQEKGNEKKYCRHEDVGSLISNNGLKPLVLNGTRSAGHFVGVVHTIPCMIRIGPNLEIDENELQFEFVRASGPGGQNVNKVSTAVQMR